MLNKMRKRMSGEGGFTLIELLVVIIIIAILAAIAIPTFLGQRQKAQDAAAKSLVRNAMTAMESQYVDTRSFDSSTGSTGAVQVAVLAIEPSIIFTIQAGAATATGIAATALASARTVGWDGTANTYSIGTVSESGNKFGVVVSKTTGGGTTYYKEIPAGAANITSGW